MVKVTCILGNQLIDPSLIPEKAASNHWIFMREDRDLCTHFRYHKHKLVFFISAMRHYAVELRNAGYQVHYESLGEYPGTFEERLASFLKKVKATDLQVFEIEDEFFETRLLSCFKKLALNVSVVSSPLFLTPRNVFMSMVANSKKPFMKTFYENQRRRLNILVDKNGDPVGGKWSFDAENRRALPKGHGCPPLPDFIPDDLDRSVIEIVEREFPEHPGNARNFWLPTTRSGARIWAGDFFANRLIHFGDYEDAISAEYPFVYHSVLTPFLNVGLLTPDECVDGALKALNSAKVPINSCEGFIRQVIGWREFVRGIYQNFRTQQLSGNHFRHRKKLTEVWYVGGTGIPPLDDAIGKVQKFGYAHHIERLMVIGSLMVLLEVEPQEAYRWFMEMFVDSSDWVMVPNVFGMALFADGGLFATKPYICGSNYYRKMSNYAAGDWCDAVDGLYWQFIAKHRDSFAKNPRMSMMVRSLEKIPVHRMERLVAAAKNLRTKLVE